MLTLIGVLAKCLPKYNANAEHLILQSNVDHVNIYLAYFFYAVFWASVLGDSYFRKDLDSKLSITILGNCTIITYIFSVYKNLTPPPSPPHPTPILINDDKAHYLSV